MIGNILKLLLFIIKIILSATGLCGCVFVGVVKIMFSLFIVVGKIFLYLVNIASVYE